MLFIESTIEKLGRILANQFNIQVVYEGNSAYTDGKKIVLPRFENVTEEIYQDLNGYLDHEVAHCKFTDFSQITKVRNNFHKNMLNAVEDSRIEKEMIQEYAGAASYIDPLNTKLIKNLHEKWATLPMPIRLILGTRDLMEGKDPKIDADTAEYFKLIDADCRKLSKCNTTEDLRVATEAIVDKIKELREKDKKKEEEKGKSGEAEGGEKKRPGKGGEKGEKKSEKVPSDKAEEPDTGISDEIDDMLNEKADAKDSEFDKHTTDVHKLVNEEIKDAIKKEEPKEDRRSRMYRDRYDFSSQPHIPLTTRFDKVTDHTAKGDRNKYGQLKKQIFPVISPIKMQLERILKVKENAKWSTDRERGKINSRDLAKLASNKAYRTVFKEFTRTETDNVAVQILVDMSGSMTSKIVVATEAVIAMSEALKDIGITFEVTGFNSKHSGEMYRTHSALDSTTTRFTRFTEFLDLHVFKNFDSFDLSGISKISVGQDNPDGEAIRWAANRLLARKEKRKILIVLSDGMPATADADPAVLNADLKNSVQKIIKAGIETIGIGIQTEAVKHFYPDYIVINNVSDLPKAAMKKLAAIITKVA